MISAPPLAVSVRGSPAIVTGEQSHEAAEDDAQTDEDHVCHHSLAIGVAEVLGRPLDIARSSDESHYVAPLHLRRGRERHRLANPGQLLQKHPSGEFHGRQIYNSFADVRPVGDHHVEHVDRKIQEFLIIYFSPDLCPAGRQQFRARQDRDDVTLAHDRVWVGLDDLALPADPGDEDASLFGTRLQFAHIPIDQIRVRDVVRATARALVC
jgi:hypothetical protein